MALNALVGALAALAIQRVLARFRNRKVALFGALAVALHPGLVGYTPALMTEGFAASLIACALWAAVAARDARIRWARMAVLGVVLGAATLVRPQCLLLAPLLGLVACPRSATFRRRAQTVLVIGALATVTCVPWTLRNCARMGRCALVSVNGGWNLLIGTSAEGRGGWAPLETPPACRTVFDEAEKDRCFEQAALERIGDAPLAWLRLADDKLAVTFDYCGAAGWYLHAANAGAFPERAKLVLGVLETAYERLALILALVACWPGSRRARRSWRMAVVIVGVAMALTRYGWLAHLSLVAALWPRRRSAVHAGALTVLASMAAVHMVFFGAGRYQLLVLPAVTALGALGAMRIAGRVVAARRSRYRRS
jgi:hypothetical protein